MALSRHIYEVVDPVHNIPDFVWKLEQQWVGVLVVWGPYIALKEKLINQDMEHTE